jgi:uncharacterized OB-fold protein
MSAPGEGGWLAALRARIGTQAAPPRTAPDPVNVPMIRRWCEAMGERHPRYLDERTAMAPPAMLEVWTMGRFEPDGHRSRNLLGIEALDAAGFTSVVATNLSQEYLRYLRPGDLITEHVTLTGVSDEKRTALGSGHFLDYQHEFTDQDAAPVGRMRFRILKFRPSALAAATSTAASPKPPHPRPSITADSAFFWEGLNERRLLIRRCATCGHLHHPPGPVCPCCHASAWSAQEMSGRGVIHSFVVVHQPQLPGFDYPLPVALVELEEGVRLVGNLIGVSLGQVHIGLPVTVEFVAVEPGYVLYAFRPQVP